MGEEIKIRASNRKSDHKSSVSVKKARQDSDRSASSEDDTKMQQRINKLYTKYADGLSGTIKPEGIEALCLDLKLDHTDVKILMLAWKMEAAKQGYFTLDEWRRGLTALQVDTISKLKKTLQELEKHKLKKSEYFGDFYTFSFRYSLTEERQKCLDIETVCVLINVVLGHQYRPQVDSFIEFLKIQSDYKVMTMDQWTGFLRFCQEIKFPELKNYDPTEAWPVILDDFVEWMKDRL